MGGPRARALLGADPAGLCRWGYEADSVPSVDSPIERFLDLTGEAQTVCWAALDQRLMGSMVQWAPFATLDDALVVGARVLDASYHPSLGHPATTGSCSRLKGDGSP
jgi:hypothetical protein